MSANTCTFERLVTQTGQWSVTRDAGARRACGARPGPTPPELCTKMNWGFSHYGCVFFFLFSFLLALRGKKNTTLWPTRMGFLHDNLDTVNHARASSVAAPSPPIVPPSQRQAPRGPSGQKTNTVLYVDSYTRQEAETVVFQIPGSFLFTLNTEDDSVRTCFLVTHPLLVRHAHLKGRLCETSTHHTQHFF